MSDITEGKGQRSLLRWSLPGGVVRTREIRLVWLAVIAFTLGVLACPFNPPEKTTDGFTPTKEEQNMSAFTQHTAPSMDSPQTQRLAATGTETATFAMG